MKNLETKFAGLELCNPIIVSSCSLTGDVNGVRTFTDVSVGAVVLKSLFEEDIIRESAVLNQASTHTEADDYLQAYIAAEALSNYINLIKESKKLSAFTKIIASINCSNSGEWVEYARAIELAGADALELNVMTIASDAMMADGELEKRHIAIAKSVCEVVNIPVIMKLGTMLSNPSSLVSRLAAYGVSGFVLFNRAYPIDIDIEQMKYTHGSILGSIDDLSTPLRHVAIASASNPNSSFSLSGSVHSGECIIKAILAGAATVSVCSILYRQGADATQWIADALNRVRDWQTKHNYESIESFRGLMNNSVEEHSDTVMRSQFLKHFSAFI
ncbi:MAG: dihydroorotate dehydrogenase-like protein [Rikenellaceae bacterium]